MSPEDLEKRCEVYRRENRRKEARAMAGAPGQIRKEQKKRDWERKAGQNWGRPIVRAQEMKEAKVNPAHKEPACRTQNILLALRWFFMS